jgi:hypothetical protein
VTRYRFGGHEFQEVGPAALKPRFRPTSRSSTFGGDHPRVEDVPKSAKLVRLRVDFGDHTRTILAGMRSERADPREIEGRQALFVVNLEPKRMAGEMSEGMLFDIGFADGITPVLAVPERRSRTASGLARRPRLL